ncbi:transposase, partial [Acidithiobacillus sp.]|uniref:transposase n=1 Tax=Acidithiobacillus sp. TaxID=1872118 RepID=UPI003D07DC7D
ADCGAVAGRRCMGPACELYRRSNHRVAVVPTGNDFAYCWAVTAFSRFIAFLEKLITNATQKIFLVVDNLRVHHAKVVSTWLAGKQDRIELVFLPPYAPESNPDEYLNRDFKTALRTGPMSTDTQSLLEKAKSFMNGLRQLPKKVARYFHHPAVRYAMLDI